MKEMSPPSDQEYLDFFDRLSYVQKRVCECITQSPGYGFRGDGRFGIANEEILHTFLSKEYEMADAAYHGHHWIELLAAGLLSFGHLEVVAILIHALPEEPTDGFTGTCINLADLALSRYLPIPTHFKPSGARERMPCRRRDMEDWYAQHQSRLRWEPSAGICGQFVLE